MAKPHKAPWKIIDNPQNGGGYWIVENRQEIILDATKSESYYIPDVNLIKTAPELLQMLKKLKKQYKDSDSLDQNIMNEISNLIKKAEQDVI